MIRKLLDEFKTEKAEELKWRFNTNKQIFSKIK